MLHEERALSKGSRSRHPVPYIQSLNRFLVLNAASRADPRQLAGVHRQRRFSLLVQFSLFLNLIRAAYHFS
jgi:hypothetical protein